MKIVGLIAEYNPFHNGHTYHIQKAKEITGADYAVVIMSGDYVQRGTPAIIPKRLRADMALHCGAAAVFELPVCYATGSAELFAFGAVSFLEQLGIVDTLCFGSECSDLKKLQTLANILLDEPDIYRSRLKACLKQGTPFPAARQNALASCLHSTEDAALLTHPNNILGIEYLKALRRLHSRIVPCTIQRKGAPYHQQTLHTSHSSASAIRTLLTSACPDVSCTGKEAPLPSGKTICRNTAGPALSFGPVSGKAKTPPFSFEILRQKLNGQVPAYCMKQLQAYYNVAYPVTEDDFSLLLKYRLLQIPPSQFSSYADVSEELANRIVRQSDQFLRYAQFCNLLKTKEITRARISRSLLHILLDIKKDALEDFLKNGPHFYAHLLGFRKDSAHILPAIAKKSRLPLLTKQRQRDALSPIGQTMLLHDTFASNLYASVVTDKFHTAFENELRQAVQKI